MPSALKRKGSPGLEEGAEPSKRRFAEQEAATTADEPSATSLEVEADTTPDVAETATPATTSAKDDRAARFAALRARSQSSRKENLKETKSEAKRAAIDPTQLTALNRKRDIAQHKLLKAETEDAGEDFERKRAWDWTVEESERWDAKQAEKARKRENNVFQDYSREAGKVYERQVGLMHKGTDAERREAYEQEKAASVNRAIANGGLELVETASGELIAVDRDGTYYSSNSSDGLSAKPDKAAVDRLVADIKKAEEVRLKKRRERGKDDEGGDVTYINEKNKQFNLKLARFYDKYTSDIRESFERGTAI